ncbi:MAG: hypothetical protein NC321_16460 [Clostridium sp.]|nr:hypothetical protein [Clostridium sp.]
MLLSQKEDKQNKLHLSNEKTQKMTIFEANELLLSHSVTLLGTVNE